MAKSRQLAKKKPAWIKKIQAENLEASNRAFLAFYEFVGAKLGVESIIDDINEKYGSQYHIGDILKITQEQEQQVLDIMEGEDEDDD